MKSIEGPFCFTVTANEYTWNCSVELISAIQLPVEVPFISHGLKIPRMGMLGDAEVVLDVVVDCVMSAILMMLKLRERT